MFMVIAVEESERQSSGSSYEYKDKIEARKDHQRISLNTIHSSYDEEWRNLQVMSSLRAEYTSRPVIFTDNTFLNTCPPQPCQPELQCDHQTLPPQHA
jgi:hypothetical protein